MNIGIVRTKWTKENMLALASYYHYIFDNNVKTSEIISMIKKDYSGPENTRTISSLEHMLNAIRNLNFELESISYIGDSKITAFSALMDDYYRSIFIKPPFQYRKILKDIINDLIFHGRIQDCIKELKPIVLDESEIVSDVSENDNEHLPLSSNEAENNEKFDLPDGVEYDSVEYDNENETTKKENLEELLFSIKNILKDILNEIRK